ncbi:MAG: winged helix-turn-helix transcriptional regulator [Lachnospiraceae bacterium]|nr:winged helix-turn-helix transcriptional regulator [Lachnospiraceae bacterium]
MQEMNFERICSNLTERLQMKKNIDEEQVNVFLDSVAENLTAEEKPKKKNSGYQALSDFINKLWRYGDFGKTPRLQVFLYGSIWAGVKILERRHKRLDRNKKINELISYYSDKEWILRAIYDKPGIRHKDLAEAGGKSASQLSQIISKASKDELISYHRLGREKYYFLMDSGETVYHEIIRRKRKQLYHYNTEFLNYEWLAMKGRNLNSQEAVYVSEKIMNYIGNRDGSINFEISAILKREQGREYWELPDMPKVLEQNDYSVSRIVQNNNDSQMPILQESNRELIYEEV